MKGYEFFVSLGIALLIVGAGCVVLRSSRSNPERMRLQLTLFVVSFAVRFVTSFLLYDMEFVTVIGDDDSSGWAWGVTYLNMWYEQGATIFDIPELFMGAFVGVNKGYKYWLATLFFITNSPFRLTAASLSCLCGALTVVFSYRLTRVLTPTPRTATFVGWTICFFPSMIIWSAQTLKEPIVIFLEVASVYGCLRLRNDRFSMRHAFLCAIPIVLLVTLRFYAAYMTAIVAILSLIIPNRSGRQLPVVPSLIIGAIVFGLISGSGALTKHADVIETYDLQRIDTLRKDLSSTANTGIEIRFESTSPMGFALNSGIGWVFLLLAPFPWQLSGSSTRLLLTMPEQVVWWVIFFGGVLPGVFYLIRSRFNDFMPLVLFVVGLGTIYSITSGNFGLMYRQRAQLFPYLFIFAAVGFEQRRARRTPMPGGVRAASPVRPSLN